MLRSLAPRLSLVALAALVFGCHPHPSRPEAPEEKPKEPEHYSESELEYVTLYGADVAPPTVLNPPPGAEITPSGLTTLLLQSGTGTKHPEARDQVVIHYTGWTQSGERFDSTESRGKPETRSLDSLVDGWREGMRLMVVGERRRLWIPEMLAFGPADEPGRPAGDIVVEVQLLDIIEAPPAPEPPKALDAPPPEATKTASGLAFVVVKEGKSEKKPGPNSRVTVHYSGWTTDGQMFDSSVMRGTPATFGVNEVIPGWTEGLQLMTEGERRILWIPADLAYGNKPQRPGAPAGDLVFDVELLKVH